jgi:serine/threonine-protein kinase
MGAVYEVEHEHTGQRLALKVLTQQPGASVERFKRETRAASLIQSEHIVRVTDADAAPELDGAPFLVMELLEGQDLERATGDAPAAPTDVVEWLRQVARALTKAHDAGIIHRDLKPENLFLTQREDGTPLVKILDFGIAKMHAEATALTASDSILGTPGYMAPEQTDSRGPPLTLRADVFALGLIAFKLLTGRMYWRSGSLAQLLAQILAEPMPPPSERGASFGPAFDAWFLRSCDRDPGRRFASASEQVEALAAALGLPPEPVRISGSAPRAAAHPASETQGSASLNASFTDLNTARRRTAKRRLFGGGIAAGVVVVGASIAVVRGAVVREVRAPATPSSVSGSAPPADATPLSSVLPRVDAVVAPASAAPPAAAVVPAPAPVPAASASAAASKRGHASPATGASAHAGPDASKGRDPLEGPW